MVSDVLIDRVWAMPNKHTFSIKPIKQLIEEEKTGLTIDPFACDSTLADITNDLDPSCDTHYHMEALEFLRLFDQASVETVLFDPPYSPRQVSECYKKLGKTVTMTTTQSTYWAKLKDEIARVTKPGGKCITFGWNSGGIGKSRGFQLSRIRLIPHGGWHNDTICVVERRL